MKKEGGREMEKVLEKVKKLGEQYNSQATRIGELLDSIADYLEECLPDGFNSFQANGIVWRRNWKSSNIGAYGSAFGLSDGYDYTLISGKPGRRFYLHGDFNAWMSTGSPKEYRETAKRLEGFLDALAKALENATQDASAAIGKLEKAVDALKE